MRRKITKFLATAFEVDGRHAQTLIPSSLKQWGRLQISNGGDLIQARGYHQLRSDGRDSSFVRVRNLILRQFIANFRVSMNYWLTSMPAAEMHQLYSSESVIMANWSDSLHYRLSQELS